VGGEDFVAFQSKAFNQAGCLKERETYSYTFPYSATTPTIFLASLLIVNIVIHEQYRDTLAYIQ
jgi:hypothetical protein